MFVQILCRQFFRVFAGLVAAVCLLASCAVSPEIQAKMDEYANTIPTCASNSDCQPQWGLARAWVAANTSFGIRSASNTRIVSTTNITSDSGIGIIVERVPTGNGTDQIIVDLECLIAYGCPQLWDMKLDFNRTVNAAN